MNADKIRVLIADDHALMRVGIRSMLETNGMTVVGEAEDGESAVSLARELGPDVVVMDLMMPGIGGAEATRRIRDTMPDTQIVLLSSYGTSVEMAKALGHGAKGALMKESPSESLVSAIRTVVAGGTAIDAEIAASARCASPEDLTDRQTDVLAAIVQGLPDKAIATKLGISTAGVRKHVSALLAKLGATSRTEAAAIAIRKQFLKP